MKFLLLIGLLFTPASLAAQNPPKPASAPAASSSWEAEGRLLEACSCAVPCPCNFGQSPTHDYCHTVYAYRLQRARWNGIVLDGLVFGGGEADKGAVGYLDSRATLAQRTALQQLAQAVFAKGGASSGARRWVWTPIKAEENARTFRVEFGASGGFAADLLLGADGKNPIVVENNVTWPVARFSKGKTTQFRYQDTLGNHLALDGVNANLGTFHLSGSTAAASAGSVKPACCAGK